MPHRSVTGDPPFSIHVDLLLVSSPPKKRQYLYKYSRNVAEHFFCAECVANFDLVSPASNFVLVDGYDADNLQFYCLQDIAQKDISIRHYSFEFEEKNEHCYEFKVVSNYFEGGRELDYLYE
jgi:hypothetical protein